MQGPLLHREVVEESGLAIGRSASLGVSVCILPAGIHHMRHVVRQIDTPNQAGLARQTGMSPCLNAIDIGRARRLPGVWFERSQSTTAHGSPGPAAQRGRRGCHWCLPLCYVYCPVVHTPGDRLHGRGAERQAARDVHPNRAERTTAPSEENYRTS